MASPITRTISGVEAPVTFTKRKNARRIKLRVVGNQVKVTVPYLNLLGEAERFVRQHAEWINQQLVQSYQLEDYQNARLATGQRILLQTGQRNSTRRMNNDLHVTIVQNHDDARKYVEKTIIKHYNDYLRAIIEPLLDEFTLTYDVYPESVKYKRMTSRWGSCSNHGVLTFSSYLAQVDEVLIRYVVAHELAHLRHLNHSSDFWSLVAQMDSSYKTHRKELKDKSMHIILN